MHCSIGITSRRNLVEQVACQMFQGGIPKLCSSFSSREVPDVKSCNLGWPNSPEAATISEFERRVQPREVCGRLRCCTHSRGVRDVPNTCFKLSLVPSSIVLLGIVIVAVATEPLYEVAIDERSHHIHGNIIC